MIPMSARNGSAMSASGTQGPAQGRSRPDRGLVRPQGQRCWWDGAPSVGTLKGPWVHPCRCTGRYPGQYKGRYPGRYKGRYPGQYQYPHPVPTPIPNHAPPTTRTQVPDHGTTTTLYPHVHSRYHRYRTHETSRIDSFPGFGAVRGCRFREGSGFRALVL